MLATTALVPFPRGIPCNLAKMANLSRLSSSPAVLAAHTRTATSQQRSLSHSPPQLLLPAPANTPILKTVVVRFYPTQLGIQPQIMSLPVLGRRELWAEERAYQIWHGWHQVVLQRVQLSRHSSVHPTERLSRGRAYQVSALPHT